MQIHSLNIEKAEFRVCFFCALEKAYSEYMKEPIWTILIDLKYWT